MGAEERGKYRASRSMSQQKQQGSAFDCARDNLAMCMRAKNFPVKTTRSRNRLTAPITETSVC